jgi:hypothetical protein
MYFVIYIFYGEKKEIKNEPKPSFPITNHESDEHDWNRFFFYIAENVVRPDNEKPTVNDYHLSYTIILDSLISEFLSDNLFILMSGEKLSATYEDIIATFEKEKNKLDDIFNEFVAKVDNVKLETLLKSQNEMKKMFINMFNNLKEDKQQNSDKYKK